MDVSKALELLGRLRSSTAPPNKAGCANISHNTSARNLMYFAAGSLLLLQLVGITLDVWVRHGRLISLVWFSHSFVMLICITILATIVIRNRNREELESSEAERRLAKSELTLRTVVDTSLDAIGISTLPDLRFIQVNQAFERMF